MGKENEKKAIKKSVKRRKRNRAVVTVFLVLSTLLLFVFVFSCIYILARTMALYTHMPETGTSVVQSSDTGKKENSSSYKYVYAQLSERFSQFEANTQPWTLLGTDQDTSAENGGKGGIYCISTTNVRYTVYNINIDDICGGYTLSDFNHMWINSEDKDFYVVVNISGKKIDLSDYYILVRDETGLYASRAIINCYEATEIILDNSIISCTLLAPNAQVHCDNTYVFGQLLAPEINGELALNKDIKFSGEEVMTQFMDIVTFKNDEVRKAAIAYLKNHDPYNKYTNHDANSDLWIDDLETVTELRINAYGEELEDLLTDLLMFPELKRLVVTNAVIDTLDLSYFTKLQDIEVSYSTISELNVTGLNDVRKLVLDYNDNMTSIDLTQMPLLEILSYNDTPLGWLDFSCCPNLTYLDCCAVEMSSDISIITGETLQNLNTLLIRYNKNITAIDLSSFPKLRSIDCTGCVISKFDFKGCDNLTYFRGSYNKASKIDFSPCISLRYIEAYSQNLKQATICSDVWSSYFYEGCKVIIKDE